jgi:DNA-binding NarL/FixJ family response regulator
MTTIRVVLAEDHPITRAGIRNLLEKAADIDVVGEAGDGSETVRLVRELAPDVLLLDMELPGLKGVEVARQLQAARAPVRILALSAYDDKEYIRGLLSSGAAGYLTKEEAPEARRTRLAEPPGCGATGRLDTAGS